MEQKIKSLLKKSKKNTNQKLQQELKTIQQTNTFEQIQS
jgi:hypothetical protein